jgi:hypothetical protein
MKIKYSKHKNQTLKTFKVFVFNTLIKYKVKHRYQLALSTTSLKEKLVLLCYKYFQLHLL